MTIQKAIDELSISEEKFDDLSEFAIENTPLHIAYKNGASQEDIYTLVDTGANLNAANIEKKTPIDIAKESGFQEIIGIFKGFGFNDA